MGRARGSRGFDRGFSDWGDFNDFNWTILQMQRESIASQEERAREAGREKRRDEVEAQQQTEAAPRAEYFDSVIEASRAALRSPRGAYYRKPGFVSTEPPGGGNAPSVEVGGILYRYEQGIFWLPQGEQFIVVTAPVGAVVDAPPAGSYRVPSAEGVLHYFFGTFFKEKEGRFAVVAPPPGAVVSYLPDGYVQETADGRTLYRFGAVALDNMKRAGLGAIIAPTTNINL